MARYEFAIYDINPMADEGVEHLLDSETDSAYEAVRKCLTPGAKGDYFIVLSKLTAQQYGHEFNPYAVWKSWETFEGMLRTHILSIKIQLNVEIDNDRAAEDLIISAIETRKLSRK